MALVCDGGRFADWRLGRGCFSPLRRGRAGSTHSVVLATGASQRQAYACAEAVRWQLTQKARALLDSQQQQPAEAASAAPLQQPGAGGPQQARGPPAGAALPRLEVAGGASSDWLALEAGPVVVHVFTARARAYYDLEGLWGAPGRVFAARGSGAAALTKDTIQ